LEIARVILRTGQRRDFPLGQLGRKALQPDVGKTNCEWPSLALASVVWTRKLFYTKYGFVMNSGLADLLTRIRQNLPTKRASLRKYVTHLDYGEIS
jgi:hypothetical protein